MRIVQKFLLLPFLFCCFLLHAQLSADFSIDKTGGCSPLLVNFTNLSGGASANAKYFWDFGNGNSSTLKNASAIYTLEQTYTVALTVTDNNQTSTKTKTITVYKKPVADFSFNTAKVCMPQSVQFTSNSTAGDGTVTNYQWDFGDGTTQQGYSNQMSHYYSIPQIPTVSLTVTNSYGCQASVTKSNLVEILPSINPSFTSNKNLLCSLDDSIQLTNTSTGPGTLLYNWNFGDGTNSTQKNPVHQYSKKAVYPVSLTVSNTVGCSATSYSLSINAAYFNTDFSNQPLCRQLSFNSSGYLYPGSSFWQFGDGTTSNSTSYATHVYTTAGNYNVTLINNYSGCKDTVTKTITVQDQVNFNSNITMPTSVCLGTNANFTTTSSVNPSSVNWDFGDGYSYTTSSNSAKHIYSQPGTYTVKILNTFGTCSETVSKTIVVNALPNLNGFIADYGGICGSPVTVSFKDTTQGATTWTWNLDYLYNNFSNQQNASYFFGTDGYHTVSLTVGNAAGCTKTVSKQLSIFRPNVNIYHIYSSSPRGNYDCDSLTIQFAVTSNQNIQTYDWDLGNGSTSSSPTPKTTYNQQGTYIATLHYTTENGCSGIATYQVRVYGKPKADFSYNIPCGNSLTLQFFDKSYYSDGWTWSFGDGGMDYYSPSPYHYYNDTGHYNVQFISHIGHCADTIVKTIYANVLPSSISIIKAANTCNGTRGTVTFDQQSVRATGGIWDFGDGTTMSYDTSAHNITHTYNASGNYQVKLSGSYGNCSYTATQTVRILLKQNPLLTADRNQLCANTNINVQIKNMEVNPYMGNTQYNQYYINKFEYNNGTQFTGSVNLYNWSYNVYTSGMSNFNAGITKLRAIIINNYTGCQDTTNYIDLQVDGPIAGFKVQNTNQCFKSPFVFVDTSRSSTTTPLKTWFWDFGDGTTQTNTSSSHVSHTYSNPGSYSVRLTVTDATGCSKTFVTTVNARGAKASFTASGLYVPNVPLNTTITFYNNSYVWSNGSINYTWIYGDGATSTNYYGSHTYTKAGTDTVYLIATDPSTSCTDTAKQVINVKDFNTAFAFSTSFLGNGSCPPVIIRINNLSVGYTNLLWDFGDGTNTTTQSYPSHIYNAPGTYKITLKTYGYNGLTGTYIDSVTITKPSAQITADVLQGCSSQNVNLQATSQNVNNYVWDFGDGNVLNGSNPLSHQYLSAGSYNPRLIVKDANGCSTSTELPNKIIIDSLSIAIKGIPPLICDSTFIQFTPDVNSYAADKLGASLIYKWDFGTGNAADTSNIKNPSFQYAKAGTYIVKFSVVSPYGCSKQTTATIIVNQKAHGAISGLSEVCQDGNIQFTGSASPAGNLQWNWDLGNGNTSTQQNPPAQIYSTSGNYVVTMTVNKNGCIDTVVHALTVNPKPVINASPKQKILCLGDSVVLSANGGGTYLWSPSVGLSNNSVGTPMASPSSSVQYNVQVTSDKGCVNNDSISITVAQPIHVQLPATADLCKGMSLQLQASGASTYQWINANGMSNTNIPNPTINPTTSTSYTVIGFDQYNCFKDTAMILVAVHDLPFVNAGPDVEIAGGIPYQLNATASNDVVSWNWSPGNYLSCTTCAAPMVTPKMQTTYIVKVSNQWGCIASDTIIVKLQCDMAHVFVPNAFTPNNDGKNDLFYIKGSGVNVIKYLRIFNRWGELVFEKTNFAIDDASSAWDGKYNGQFVATGAYVYIAEMECSTGNVFTLKGTVTVIH